MDLMREDRAGMVLREKYSVERCLHTSSAKTSGTKTSSWKPDDTTIMVKQMGT